MSGRVEWLRSEVVPRLVTGTTGVTVEGEGRAAVCLRAALEGGGSRGVVARSPHTGRAVFRALEPHAELLQDVLPPHHFVEDTIVVLDDARPAKHPKHLDLHHVTRALEAMARLHGVCIARGVESPSGDEEPDLEVCSRRAVLRLLEDGSEEVTREDLERLDWALRRAPDVAQEASRPARFVVPCGGELLYRYDASGRPQRAVFLDFSPPLLSAPALDLALFLFTHTDRDFRNEHLKHVLCSYHASLLDAVRAVSGQDLEFPLRDLQQDFGRRAVYAYIATCHRTVTELDEAPQGATGGHTAQDRRTHLLTLGGETITWRLIDLLTEFHQRGYFTHLLDQHVMYKL